MNVVARDSSWVLSQPDSYRLRNAVACVLPSDPETINFIPHLDGLGWRFHTFEGVIALLRHEEMHVILVRVGETDANAKLDSYFDWHRKREAGR